MNITFGSTVKLTAYNGDLFKQDKIDYASSITLLPINTRTGIEEAKKTLEDNEINDSVEIRYSILDGNKHIISVENENGLRAFNPLSHFKGKSPSKIKKMLIDAYEKITVQKGEK